MQASQTEIVIRASDGSELVRTTLPPGDYVIGADPACHLHVMAEGVSRRHAQLTIHCDHALVEDLGSSNGTRVNGQPVMESTRLWPGQRIGVGSATIELRRQKTLPLPDASLAPNVAITRDILPEEILRERKYNIGRVVAQGGMGAILSAQEGAIDRAVAMKVMLDGSSPDDLVRFIAEARVTGQLEHPNIVPVHELGVDENDQVFYTMKFVRGITLRAVLEQMAASDAATIAKYPLATLLTVFQKVCDAVAFAHSKGVIHRDLKPENIMLGDFGEVLLMDWGLAKILGRLETSKVQRSTPGGGATEDVARSLLSAMPEVAGATMGGAIMGTPQYMAPEQARGEVDDLDARADIYALGAILYHVLALRPSVLGDDAYAIVERVARGEVDALINPGREAAPRVPKSPAGDRRRTRGAASLPHLPGGSIPDGLAAVVRKAMAFDRAQRYASVADLQADLTAYQTGFATSAEQAGLGKQLVLLIKRHKGIFTTAAAAWLLITALGAWFVFNLRAKERRAVAGEESAKAAESVAVKKEAETRKALARSALSLAEAALRERNGPAMQAALSDVPEEMRDSTWRYLLDESDTSIARIEVGAEIDGVAAHPRLPGVFAVGDRAGKVTFVNVHTGERLFAFTPAFPNSPAVTGYRLAISADGERIAVGRKNGGGGIVIHSTRDGRRLSGWEAPDSARLEFSPKEQRLLLQTAKTGTQFFLNLWGSDKGRLEWTYRSSLQTPAGTHGVFTPDGRQIVTFGHGDNFRVVDPADGKSLSGFRGENDVTVSMAIGPAGRMAYGDRHGFITLTNLADGRRQSAFRVHDNPIEFLALAPDGGEIVTAVALPDGRQSIEVWEPGSATRVRAMLGGMGPIRNLSIHPLSGDLIVSGPNTRVWSLHGSEPRWILAHTVSGRSVAFWGAEDRLFTPDEGNGMALRQLRPGGSEVLWREAAFAPHASVSADGRLAAVAINHQVTVLRNSEAAPEQVAAIKTDYRAKAVRLSPAGNRVLVIEFSGARAELFETATGTQPARLERQEFRRFHDVGWLGGERLLGLVTANTERGEAGAEERIVVWDARSGKVLQTRTHPGAIDVLAIAPDGRRFAGAGEDKRLRIHDAGTLAVLREFRVHDGPITAVAWHPKKPIVATASSDLSIRLWDAETGRRLEGFRGPHAAPRGLAFSPTGQRLACVTPKEPTRVWDPPSLRDRPDAPLDSHGKAIDEHLWFSDPTSYQPAAPEIDGDGWADVFRTLTPDYVSQVGHGWRLVNGELFSPDAPAATLPLPGDLSGTSYQVRIRLRRITGLKVFHLTIPVGDGMTALELDAMGHFTGLHLVDGESVQDVPGVVQGTQVKGTEPHDLDVIVRLDGANVTVTATLDTRPLYEWSGPTARLSQGDRWKKTTRPGSLAFGTFDDGWAVSEVKVKRLEGRK